MFFFFHMGADGRVNWWIPLVMFLLTGVVPNLLDIPFFGSSPPPPLRQQVLWTTPQPSSVLILPNATSQHS